MPRVEVVSRPPVSHVDRGQLFGLAADGSMYVEAPLELVGGSSMTRDTVRRDPLAEVEAAGAAGESLEDYRAGHRPELERPGPEARDFLEECPTCGAECFWDYILGRWCHD